MLTTIISVSVAVVAFVLSRALFRLAAERARAAIKAIVVADAVFLAAAILLSIVIVTWADGSGLGAKLSALSSSGLLWAIRMMFVAIPLLTLLYVHRPNEGLSGQQRDR
jgi:hypothetical protein